MFIFQTIKLGLSIVLGFLIDSSQLILVIIVLISKNALPFLVIYFLRTACSYFRQSTTPKSEVTNMDFFFNSYYLQFSISPMIIDFLCFDFITAESQCITHQY